MMTNSPLATNQEITSDNFLAFREYFYKKTGIWFEPERRYFVDKRIQSRIIATHCRDFKSWFNLLKCDSTPGELQSVINVMTVNETYFYREDYQYECLVNSILPEITGGRSLKDPIRIWSLPCATGEEPYSIAIWLSENWPELESRDVELRASDIDTTVLAKAQEGLFASRSIERLPNAVRRRWLKPDGTKFRVHSDLRESVSFTVANLSDLRTLAGVPPQDVIFCRNVLIYFDADSRAKAAEYLYSALRPGGFLLLGHSESMARISSAFSLRRFKEGIVYQRPRSS